MNSSDLSTEPDDESEEVMLFHEAIALPASQLDEFLRRKCLGRPELEARVRKFVDAHRGDSEDWLEKGRIELSGRLAGLRPGAMISHRYELLDNTPGQGSYGEVWRARQLNPEVLVAIKILKSGHDSREVVARFEQEQELLASLNHPGIAKIFESGVTPKPEERAFFAMELIEGPRITAYCDLHALSLEQRLRLFQQVCRAVAHAHQRLVVHRDLKPSNILVPETDGHPTPKLIDFGIAKVTHKLLSAQSLIEGPNQILGTLPYMSPEQIKPDLSGTPIDTVSDIYSLGVILYELLTGTLPIDLQGLDVRQNPDEVQRRICETIPPKPSDRVSALEAVSMETTARSRQTPPAKLSGRLAGDLDMIALKALEKDGKQRYFTTLAFADDIERYLTKRPVEAYQGRGLANTLYASRKAAKRHWLAFSTSIMLILAITSAWVVSSSALRRAETELNNRQQILELFTDTVSEIAPAAGNLQDSASLKRILKSTAQAVSDSKASMDAEVEFKIRQTLGDVYFQLGSYREATFMRERALELASRIYGDQSTEVASASINLANALRRQSKRKQAEQLIRRAIEIREKTDGKGATSVASAMNDLGLIMLEENRFEETVAAYEHALTIYTEADGNHEPSMIYPLLNLGITFDRHAKSVEAEKNLRNSLALCETYLPSDHRTTARCLASLAKVIYAKRDRSADELIESQYLAERARDMFNRLLPGDHTTRKQAQELYNRIAQRQPLSSTGQIQQLP